MRKTGRRTKKKSPIKQPKTGNKKWVKQWIYVYWNIPFFWVVKIGVTGHFWRRWIDVCFDKGNWGFDIPVPFMCFSVYGAYNIEQANRRFWKKIFKNGAKIPGFMGTGKTERFWFFALIPAVLMMWLFFLVEWAIKIGVLYAGYLGLKNLPDHV